MFCADTYPSLAVVISAKHLGLKKASNPPTALLLYPSPSPPCKFGVLGFALSPGFGAHGITQQLLVQLLLRRPQWGKKLHCCFLADAGPCHQKKEERRGKLALVLRAPRGFRSSADPQPCI